MNQLTFFDKIQVLFKLLISSPIVIGIFAFSLLLMIILFFSSRLHRKVIKYIFIGIYVLIIGFSIYKYGRYFLTSIDSFLTLFMANIYFPIVPIYVAIMIISFIIMIVTLSGRSKSRIIKIVNTVFFTLIQMLFVVFIYTIEANKIDLSTNTSLYSNDQTMTLLESGMGLFVIWIVLLGIIIYLKKADKIFKVKKSDEVNDFDEYINDYNEPKSVVDKNIERSGVEDLDNPHISIDKNLSVLNGSFNTNVPIVIDSKVDDFSSANMTVNTNFQDKSVSDNNVGSSNDDIKSFMSDLSNYVQSVDFGSDGIKPVNSYVEPRVDKSIGDKVVDPINKNVQLSIDEVINGIDEPEKENINVVSESKDAGVDNSFELNSVEENSDFNYEFKDNGIFDTGGVKDISNNIPELKVVEDINNVEPVLVDNSVLYPEVSVEGSVVSEPVEEINIDIPQLIDNVSQSDVLDTTDKKYNSIIEKLVPEIAEYNYGMNKNSSDKVTIPVERNSVSISNFNENKVNSSVSDIFNSFEFLDVPSNPIERKNDDVEVLDFE